MSRKKVGNLEQEAAALLSRLQVLLLEGKKQHSDKKLRDLRSRKNDKAVQREVGRRNDSNQYRTEVVTPKTLQTQLAYKAPQRQEQHSRGAPRRNEQTAIQHRSWAEMVKATPKRDAEKHPRKTADTSVARTRGNETEKESLYSANNKNFHRGERNVLLRNQHNKTTKKRENEKGPDGGIQELQRRTPQRDKFQYTLALFRTEQEAIMHKYRTMERALQLRTKWHNALTAGTTTHHCPICAYTHNREEHVLQHCRQRHGDAGRCFPYTLQSQQYGVAPAGASCALASVVGIIAQLPEEATLTDVIRHAYTNPTRKNTELLTRALNISLPIAPLSALEVLIEKDPVLQHMFAAQQVTTVSCELCGQVAAEPTGTGTTKPAIFTLDPQGGKPVQLTQATLRPLYSEKKAIAYSACNGEHKGTRHDPTPLTRADSHIFGDGVAIEFGHWNDKPTGVETIPFSLDLPSRNITSRYDLVGVVAAVTPTHVASFIPCSNDNRTWIKLDGMHRQKINAGIDPEKVILCLYHRTPDDAEETDDDEEEEADDENRHYTHKKEEEEEEVGRYTGRRRQITTTTQRQRDARGRLAYGIDNTSEESEEDEESNSHMRSRTRTRRENSVHRDTEQLTQNALRDTVEEPTVASVQLTQSTTPTTRTRNSTQNPQATTTAQRDETTGRALFSHEEVLELSLTVQCPIEGCKASFEGRRRNEGIRSHANGFHTEAQRRETPREKLTAQGLVRCEQCYHLLVASNAARKAHLPRCGEQTSRKEQIAASRAAYRCSTGGEYARRASTREIPVPTTWPALPDTDPLQDPWLQERITTRRYLHRREWPNWLEVCRSVFLGYNASEPHERYRRQAHILNLVRTHLPTPTRGTPEMEDGSAEGKEAHIRQTQEVQQQQNRQQHDDDDVDEENDRNTYPSACPAEDEEAEKNRAIRRKARRAETLCILSATGRAARLLAAPDAVPVRYSDELIENLDALYPQEDTTTFPQPETTCPTVTLDAKEVARIIGKRLTRGAAPGLDGWTRELLYPLIKDVPLLTELTSVLTDFLNSNISTEVAHRIRATSLTVLRKPNGKLRPIGAESVWAKMISIIALDAVAKPIQEKFAGIQFGVGNNGERAIEKIRQDFTAKGSLATLDGRNAYNAISRRAILEATYADEAWRPLWRVTRLLLGTAGIVGFYEQGTMIHAWRSTRGVRQGMVLGPILFSIGTLATLRRLERTYLEAAFTAYLDDVTIAAPPEQLAGVCKATAQAMERLGIANNAEKTEVLDPSGIATAGGGIPVGPSTISRVLGAWLANDPASPEITTRVTARAQETERLFTAIDTYPLAKRTRWRLLAAATLPRMTFLLRTHDPQHTQPAASWFDERVTATLGHILERPVTQRARDIAALPVCRGGCGLRRQLDVAAFAHSCTGKKGLQRQMTEELEERRYSDLYHTLQGSDRSLLSANSASGAGRPLTDAQVQTDDRSFTIYLQERLLLRVLPEGQECVCGEDATNEHVHTCTRLHSNPRTIRHEMMNLALANGLRLCGFHCALEPRLSEASKKRPDILIAGLGTYAITDITVTYPGRVSGGGLTPVSMGQQNAESTITTQRDATGITRANDLGKEVPLGKANERYAEKQRKYAPWSAANGLDFAPVVFLTNGAIHPNSRRWLMRVLGSHDHRLAVHSAYDTLSADVLVALLRGNVHVFNVAASRGGGGRG